ARRVLGPGQVLVPEVVARAALAGSGRVAALQDVDAAGGEPVALGVAEVALLGQGDERVDRAGGLAVGQVDDDVAAVGGQRGLVAGLVVRLGRRQADLAGGGTALGVRAGVRGLGHRGGRGGRGRRRRGLGGGLARRGRRLASARAEQEVP